MITIETRAKAFERTVQHHGYLRGCMIEIQDAIAQASLSGSFNMRYSYSPVNIGDKDNKQLVNYLRMKKYKVYNESDTGFTISWK